MSLQDRENQRRSNSIVGNFVDNSSEEEKGVLKPRSYYLTKRLYKSIGIKAALESVDKSQIVRWALTAYLHDVLEEYKDDLNDSF